jgi:hypothetical protein
MAPLGEPNHVDGTSRKQRLPLIWKYDEFEFHFGEKGKVWLIYTEDQDGQPRVLAGPTGPRQRLSDLRIAERNPARLNALNKY